MEKMKICYLCDQHENPYKNTEYFDGTKDNPDNFTQINWFAENKHDDVHEECLIVENQ